MLVVLVGSLIYGAMKGMAWQVASLASLFLSAAVAIRFGEPVAHYFLGEHSPMKCSAVMLVLYFATSLVIWLLFRLVAGVIDRVQLKEFDRQMGGLFGAAKGVFWCFVITFFAVTLSEAARQHVLKSKSGYFAAGLIKQAGPLLPEEVMGVIGKHLDDFEGRLNPDTPPKGIDLVDEATRRLLEDGSEYLMSEQPE